MTAPCCDYGDHLCGCVCTEHPESPLHPLGYGGTDMHCSTCNCPDDVRPPQPSTSSEWARRQAREAAAEAVRVAKERRLAAAKGGKP